MRDRKAQPLLMLSWWWPEASCAQIWSFGIVSIPWKTGIHVLWAPFQLWQLLFLYHFLGNHQSVPGEEPLAASAWIVPLLCPWCCWCPCCAPHGTELLLLFFHWLSLKLWLWWPIKSCLWHSIDFLAQIPNVGHILPQNSMGRPVIAITLFPTEFFLVTFLLLW